MSLKRKGSWLAAWVLVLLAGLPAFAQNARDMQLFAPADPSTFGGGPRPNEGFFFNYEGLYWTIQAPEKAVFGNAPDPLVGVPVWWGADTTTTQTSDMDTSFLKTEWAGGQRMEFGNLEGHHGWMFSYMELSRLTQAAQHDNVQVLFGDSKWGLNGTYNHLDGHTGSVIVPPATDDIRRLGVQFDTARLETVTKFWGVEAAYLYRVHPFEGGSYAELVMGPRYLEFNEKFNIDALGGILDRTTLNSQANNHMVGGEIGARLTHTCDRWTYSALGLFAGTANMQTMRLNGAVASSLANAGYPRGVMLPIAMGALNVDHSVNKTEFSPVIELRVEAKYQVTRAVSIKAGWNGLWMDNIARPTSMIDYTFHETSALGILSDRNKQSVFMNGLAAGIEINR